MVNIDQKTVTPYNGVYTYNYGGIVVDDVIVWFPSYSTSALSVTAIDGTSKDIQFEQIFSGGAHVYAKHGAIYCYTNGVGVNCFYLSGQVATLIPAEDIQVKDYQSLSASIGSLAVGTEDHIAFYDSNLKCIRLIQPAGSTAE